MGRQSSREGLHLSHFWLCPYLTTILWIFSLLNLSVLISFLHQSTKTSPLINNFTLKLPDKSSIFTAEMYALLIAFQQIEKKHQETFYYFFGIKIGFTGLSVERLDKSTDFTTA